MTLTTSFPSLRSYNSVLRSFLKNYNRLELKDKDELGSEIREVCKWIFHWLLV